MTERFELCQEITVRAMRAVDAKTSGHHFKVRVSLGGPLDPVSGLVFDRDRLARILDLSVARPLDGALLNELFPDVSGAGLARSLYLRLKPVFPEGMLTRVSIQETKDDYFDFPG